MGATPPSTRDLAMKAGATVPSTASTKKRTHRRAKRSGLRVARGREAVASPMAHARRDPAWVWATGEPCKRAGKKREDRKVTFCVAHSAEPGLEPRGLVMRPRAGWQCGKNEWGADRSAAAVLPSSPPTKKGPTGN